MGKWLLCAQHPCNDFAARFHNCLLHRCCVQECLTRCCAVFVQCQMQALQRSTPLSCEETSCPAQQPSMTACDIHVWQAIVTAEYRVMSAEAVSCARTAEDFAENLAYAQANDPKPLTEHELRWGHLVHAAACYPHSTPASWPVNCCYPATVMCTAWLLHLHGKQVGLQTAFPHRPQAQRLQPSTCHAAAVAAADVAAHSPAVLSGRTRSENASMLRFALSTARWAGVFGRGTVAACIEVASDPCAACAGSWAGTLRQSACWLHQGWSGRTAQG